jgi:carboxyl-terminal processing protease
VVSVVESQRVIALTRGSIVALIATLLTACAPLPMRNLHGSQAEILHAARHPIARPSKSAFASANATPDKRSDTLNRVWQSIRDYYYDPTFTGVDMPAIEARSIAEMALVRNDAEFYRVLKRNVDALHDSHTEVLTPRQAEDDRTQQATQIGLVYEVIDGHVAIEEIVPGFPAEEAGMKVGMIIERIDDVTIDAAFLARAVSDPVDASEIERRDVGTAETEAAHARRLQSYAIRSLLYAYDGQPRPHRLTLRRNDDTALQVEVTARTGEVPTVERYAVLPSGIGVLRLSRFDASVRRRLARDIDLARQQTRGLIIDLRDNPGGELFLFRWLVGRFIEHHEALGQLIGRSGQDRVTLDLDDEPTDHPYLKPIALLIDGATASAAELTAHALVELRQAIAVGEPSCGCVVGIRREFTLPDGGALRVSEIGFLSAHHRRMEADPLVPDIAPVRTLAELRAGDDVVLHAAEKALIVH